MGGCGHHNYSLLVLADPALSWPHLHKRGSSVESLSEGPQEETVFPFQ